MSVWRAQKGELLGSDRNVFTSEPVASMPASASRRAIRFVIGTWEDIRVENRQPFVTIRVTKFVAVGSRGVGDKPPYSHW